MKSHKNYGIYKQLRRDIRDGRLMMHDRVYVYQDDGYILGYQLSPDADFEEMTAQELMDLTTRKAT